MEGISIDNLNLWLSFVEFVLGTFVLGGVSLVINYSIKTHRIQVEKEKSNAAIALEEQKHLATFLETALLKDVGPRRRMAQYFADVTQSEGLRGGWLRYLNRVETEYVNILEEEEEKRAEIAVLEEKRKQIERQEDKSKEKQHELETLASELRKRAIEISRLHSQLAVRAESDEMSPQEWVLEIRKGRKDLSSANLRGTDLSGMDLKGVDLRVADLSSTNLKGVDLRGVDLSSTNLKGVDLSRAKLANANLSNSDLRGAFLNRADMTGAILRYANLSGAQVRSAHLRRSDLMGANLSRSNLTATDFLGAYLDGADFSDANLTSAELINAIDVEKAIFNGAYADPKGLPTLPEGISVLQISGDL